MTTNRRAPKLKLARSEHLQPVADGPALAADADLGGIGLDWDATPPLSGVGLTTWQHLADTFRSQPTRFREADRPAVTAFCEVAEMRALAAEQLRAEGVTDVAVCGIATDYCVRATALDAAGEGFATTVLLDLTAAVAPANTDNVVGAWRAAGVVVAEG